MKHFKCPKCLKIHIIADEHPKLSIKQPRMLCDECGYLLYLNKKNEITPPGKIQKITVSGGIPARITKEYLEAEAIKIHEEEQNSQSLRTAIEVFKICYGGQDEQLIELDMEEFELVSKSIKANKNFRPEPEGSL